MKTYTLNIVVDFKEYLSIRKNENEYDYTHSGTIQQDGNSFVLFVKFKEEKSLFDFVLDYGFLHGKFGVVENGFIKQWKIITYSNKFKEYLSEIAIQEAKDYIDDFIFSCEEDNESGSINIENREGDDNYRQIKGNFQVKINGEVSISYENDITKFESHINIWIEDDSENEILPKFEHEYKG